MDGGARPGRGPTPSLAQTAQALHGRKTPKASGRAFSIFDFGIFPSHAVDVRTNPKTGNKLLKDSGYVRQYRLLLKRLRQARLDAGLTQSQVANRLGRRQSYVSKCESGERRVDAVELLRFAKAYRKPLFYFLQDSEE